MKCVNRKSKEFKDLMSSTGMSEYTLATQIGKWQDTNSSNEFPTANELLGVSPGSYAVYNNNLELQAYGTEIQYGQYASTTDNPTLDGFIEHVSNEGYSKYKNNPLGIINNDLPAESGLSTDMIVSKNEKAFDTAFSLRSKEQNIADMSEELFSNKDNLNVNEVFNNFITHFADDISSTSKLLIDKFKKINGVSNVEVQFIERNELPPDSQGYWNSIDNTIYLSKDVLLEMTNEQILYTLLHETIHAKTAKSILEPKTNEDFELVESVQNFIDNYGDQSNFYGFVHPMEFVSELYSNTTFQEEVRRLYREDQNGRSWINRILDSIRRLFGIRKPNAVDKTLEQIVFNLSLTSQEELDGNHGIFNLINLKMPNFTNNQSRLDFISRKVLNALDRQKSIVRNVIEDKTMRKNIITEIDQKAEKLVASKNTEKIHLISEYMSELNIKAVSILNDAQKLRRYRDSNNQRFKKIQNIQEWMSLFDFAKEVSEHIENTINQNTNDNGTLKRLSAVITAEELEDYRNLQSILKDLTSVRSEIDTKLKSYKKLILQDMISNPVYITEVHSIFRDKYAREYENLSQEAKNNTSKPTYINNKMKENSKSINAEISNVASELIYSPYKDIGMGDLYMTDYLNTNHGLFQVATNIDMEMRDKIMESFRIHNQITYKVFQNFNKESNNSLSMSKKYGNLLQQDESGNYYLKGRYKVSVYDSYKQARNRVYDRLFSDFKPINISDIERSNIKEAGMQSLFRAGSSTTDIDLNDVINLRTNDTTSNINTKVQELKTYQPLNTLDDATKDEIANAAGFDSFRQLIDSKKFALDRSEGSKIHTKLFEYLENPDTATLDIISFTRQYLEDNVNLKEQPEIQEWFQIHTNGYELTGSSDSNGNPIYKYEIKDTFVNSEYTSLSQVEKDTIQYFVNTQNRVDKSFEGRSSLFKTIPGIEDVSFLRLPSQEKSELEMRNEGQFKRAFTDKYKRLFEIKNDDIEYRMGSYNEQGEKVHKMEPHYRGFIKPEDQSLDLFTLFDKEAEQGIRHEHRKKAGEKFQIMVDVMKDKKYLRVTNGMLDLNRNHKNEPVLLIDGATTHEVKKMQGLIETNLYDIHTHNDTKWGPVQAAKAAALINGYAATVALTLNEASGVANILNGMTQLHLDAIGRNTYNLKNLKKAEAKYTKDLPNIFKDIVSPNKQSFTNQVLQMFDVVGGVSLLQQEYIKNNLLNTVATSESMNVYNNSGEHMMVSVLSFAVLDSIKVMDSKGNLIDAEGNIVKTEKQAASLLDMLKFNKNGLLEIDKKVVYTTHTHNIGLKQGGKSHISMLIKKRSHDMFGVYDPALQGEAMKKWYGKSIMMFKRFFISGLQYRYRGYSNITKHPDEMTRADKIYNSSLKQYEEGYYVTLAKMVMFGVTNLKTHGLAFTKEYYNNLSDYEKNNIRKAVAELAVKSILLPAIGMVLAAGFDDDDDNWFKFFTLYQVNRLSMELGQFYNPLDLSKMTANPVAGMRFIQNALKLGGSILSPINLSPEGNEQIFDWMSEDVHGKNKLMKDIFRMSPGLARLNVDYKNMVNGKW